MAKKINSKALNETQADYLYDWFLTHTKKYLGELLGTDRRNMTNLEKRLKEAKENRDELLKANRKLDKDDRIAKRDLPVRTETDVDDETWHKEERISLRQAFLEMRAVDYFALIDAYNAETEASVNFEELAKQQKAEERRVGRKAERAAIKEEAMQAKIDEELSRDIETATVEQQKQATAEEQALARVAKMQAKEEKRRDDMKKKAVSTPVGALTDEEIQETWAKYADKHEAAAELLLNEIDARRARKVLTDVDPLEVVNTFLDVQNGNYTPDEE